MNTLIRNDVMVEWDELGEGLNGDYNPDDPEDVELLRFTVYQRDALNGEWVPCDDASYCTQVPVTATPDVRERLLTEIMDAVYPRLQEHLSIKKDCECLSWVGDLPEAIPTPHGRALGAIDRRELRL